MPLKLIIAEDDGALRETLLTLLQIQFPDLCIDAVGDGSSLVSRVEADHYGLVLTDNQMPQLTGLDAIRTIRGFNGTIPIYLLTGDAVQKKALEVGATGFLPKPPPLTSLYALVEQYFR